MSENFLTISELNNFIRDVLKSGFPQAIWVCGEIQELREKSGHLYFTLSEKDENTQTIVAKMGVSIWANTRLRIESILAKAENPFQLKEDIQVKLLVQVDFYPPFGQIRLIAQSIDPLFTLGKIAQERLKLIAQLKKEGILDLNKQLSLPLVPLRIGLITSHDSAAYHDFTDELKRSGFGFQVRLIDSIMQGKNTEQSIVQALQELGDLNWCDIIVITRGGGSVTDLSAFDNAAIAKAISQCPVAVITGIGHEINTSIADLAAHTTTKTPTATAQWLIGRVQDFCTILKEREEKLVRLSTDLIDGEQRRLKDLAQGLKQATQELVKQHQTRLLNLTSTLLKHPLIVLKENRRRVQEQGENLKKTIRLNLENKHTKISAYKKLIEMADPKNTLKRGFSITRTAEGKVVKSLKDVKHATHIRTQVVDGEITSTL